MRKLFFLFVILAATSVVFLFCGAAAVNDGRNDIVVTETTLAGDVSAAQGLQVRTNVNESRQLYWTTNYTVSSHPEPDTDFRYYQLAQHHYGGEPEKEVYFSTPSGGFGISGVINLKEEQAYIETQPMADQMLLRPVVDLADRVKAGETRTEILDLSDYYAYYPVYLQCDWAGMENVDEIAAAHWAFYQEYFPLPVPENSLIEVSVEKDGEGRVIHVSSNTYYPENYEDPSSEEAVSVEAYTYTESVVMDDAAYFILCGTHDYSKIKGGYGLYRIPISYHTEYGNLRFSEPQAMLEAEQIENVFPMEPDSSKTIYLRKGVTERELLLFVSKEDAMTVTVLDTETFAVRQKLELRTVGTPDVWFHEKLVIMAGNDYEREEGRLQVLRYEDGVYGLWLDTEWFAMNNQGYYFLPVFAFDGDRFAMASFDQYYEVASHRITVYDQNGLIYAGDYHYSSDDLTRPITNYNWEEPLRISWQ